ncbi:MAG: outer membrane beta-barrel protein [Bacteroidales bacterium]|nr:outer membrane beta-barrel protein [Bacteroidales bacterium]
MKKIVLILTIICLGSFAYSQQADTLQMDTSKKAKKNTQIQQTIEDYIKPILFKDRIVLDFLNTMWFGFEKESALIDPSVKPHYFNFSFTGAVIFDIPVKRNSPFSFGIGLGVSNYNMYSNGIFGIGEGYTATLTPIPDYITKYRKNKMSYTNLHIPLEFRYRHKCGFKISAGVRVGIILDLHSKYFGPALDGSEDKDLIKDYKLVNRTKIPVEVTFRTGWKFVGVTASYMVTKLFEAEKGPQICPFSFGISLCPY